MLTDFPDPVAPAISRCGIRARSPTRTVPATSLPRATANFDFTLAEAIVKTCGDDIEFRVEVFFVGWDENLQAAFYGETGGDDEDIFGEAFVLRVGNFI